MRSEVWDHVAYFGHFELSLVSLDEVGSSQIGTSCGTSHPRPDSLDGVKRSLGAYGAAGQLQQRPAPDEGGILKRGRRGWWDGNHESAGHFDQRVQSWDMSFGDNEEARRPPMS